MKNCSKISGKIGELKLFSKADMNPIFSIYILQVDKTAPTHTQQFGVQKAPTIAKSVKVAKWQSNNMHKLPI